MILLTKQNCGQCDDFKNFLSFTALGKKHSDKIDIWVQEDSDEISFNSILQSAKTQGAASFPILVDNKGKLLMTGFDATKVIGIFKSL